MRMLTLAATMMMAAEARAELLINPSIGSNNKTNLEGVVASSEVEYETDDNEFDIERSILGANIGFGVAKSLNIVGQFGLIADTEVENIERDGDGYLIGGGARFALTQSGKLSLAGHAVFSYQQETIKANSIKHKFNTRELHTGLTAVFQALPTVAPYAGLNLIIFDDGEWKANLLSTNVEIDIERADMLGLKLGVNIMVDQLTIRPEITVFGEQTLLLGVGSYL